MKEYIKKLLDKWLCMHDWELKVKTNYEYNDGGYEGNYYIYTYACKKCGKFHKMKSS